MRILFRTWLLTLLFAVTAGQSAADDSPLTFSVKNDDYQALKSTIASKDQSTISPFEQFQLAVSAWRLGDLKAAKKRLKPLIDANYAIGDSLYLKGLIHLSEVDRVSIFKKLGAAKKHAKPGLRPSKKTLNTRFRCSQLSVFLAKHLVLLAGTWIKHDSG